MWTHSAPCSIIRLISLDKFPRSLARTEGEMIGRGLAESAFILAFKLSSRVELSWTTVVEQELQSRARRRLLPDLIPSGA